MDKLRSIFVEQKLVRSLCCQLCPDEKMERAMEQKECEILLNCRSRQWPDTSPWSRDHRIYPGQTSHRCERPRSKEYSYAFSTSGVSSTLNLYPKGPLLIRHSKWRCGIDAVRCKRGELWRERSLILHHYNAPANSSLRVQQFLSRKSISATDYPPYSPDLAAADFWLCPKLKECAKRKAFLGH
jgi:hypothetical protein